MLNLDRNTIGPRVYTLTYRVLDILSNATDVECVVRVVDPLAPNVDDCNGIDDDGDGEVDEDFVSEIVTCSLGVCVRQGITICTIDGTMSRDCVSGVPRPERCGNGIDDDCDGQADNGFDVGAPCTFRVGLCARDGEKVCTADELGTECNAMPGEPGVEQCDGIDDDCDGVVDNGFAAGDPCSAGVGACLRDGVTNCTADGTGVECGVSPGAPGEALCGNGVDDDCDGETDEGFVLGLVCTAGEGVCRADGSTVCAPTGSARSATRPSARPGPSCAARAKTRTATARSTRVSTSRCRAPSAWAPAPETAHRRSTRAARRRLRRLRQRRRRRDRRRPRSPTRPMRHRRLPRRWHHHVCRRRDRARLHACRAGRRAVW